MNMSSRFFADTALTPYYGYVYVMAQKMNVIAMGNKQESI